MFSRFFIYRPIFATVLSIVIVIAGVVTLGGLPIAQFPEITPPTVQVQAVYPGASAQVIAKTVGAPIEQQVNGVEGMLYMASTSSSDGLYKLTITFEVGTDLDQAAVLVQNRVSIAQPSLPEDVTRQGVTTKKQSPNILLLVSLFAPDGQYDSLYLSNYATLRLKDEVSRVQGVGDVTIFGSSDYSLRVWLEPRRLKSRNLTTQEVIDAMSLTVQREGLIPALESSHAFAQAFKEVGDMDPDDSIIINQSGRADKDIFTVADALKDPKWEAFIIAKAKEYQNA